MKFYSVKMHVVVINKVRKPMMYKVNNFRATKPKAEKAGSSKID